MLRDGLLQVPQQLRVDDHPGRVVVRAGYRGVHADQAGVDLPRVAASAIIPSINPTSAARSPAGPASSRQGVARRLLRLVP
ncbi:hypothetical protein SAM40697_6876 [Streptomyces ambofaciens]|uniref:Uncharacterized protein n=1 Tax=Streptomyces ambofaciens TaxID=1889 RepID=A0ABM6BA55_STRAM|nr:hypothetical protein SAM40697_0049 [Streptomyces ambofaciens]ANB10828.1 hypothetical protein SAM40697_6876 [Streptomyces ambofaciens]